MNARRAQTNCLTSLKKRDDFVRARTQGRKWTSQGVILQAVARVCSAPTLPGAASPCADSPPDPAAPEGPAPKAPALLRFGITVTKKVDRRAVVRNRIKRRLRAAAASALHRARRDYDYVLIGRIETLARPYDRLCQDIVWCLSKMDLLADCAERTGPPAP